MKVYKIIPFRLSSRRFPNKPLESIFGKTMIENALDIAGLIKQGGDNTFGTTGRL
jgi:CMP-2-keto-3-deoxyoctulosonic acid synthetase